MKEISGDFMGVATLPPDGPALLLAARKQPASNSGELACVLVRFHGDAGC